MNNQAQVTEEPVGVDYVVELSDWQLKAVRSVRILMWLLEHIGREHQYWNLNINRRRLHEHFPAFALGAGYHYGDNTPPVWTHNVQKECLAVSMWEQAYCGA